MDRYRFSAFSNYFPLRYTGQNFRVENSNLNDFKCDIVKPFKKAFTFDQRSKEAKMFCSKSAQSSGEILN